MYSSHILSTNGNSASFMSFSSEKSAQTVVLVFLIAAHIHTHTECIILKQNINYLALSVCECVLSRKAHP